MCAVLAVYSVLFMRFAWMVQPRNYLLLACHACNSSAQAYQLSRKVRYEMSDEGKARAAQLAAGIDGGPPTAAAAAATVAPSPLR